MIHPHRGLARQNVFLLLMSVALLSILSGCTLLDIHLTPSISPLQEKVLKGEGSNKILVLDIKGMISNRSRSTLLGSKVDVGMVERVRETLNLAEEDDAIKAMVLRINSPGGTVTSSDMIYHEIRSFKERKKIPVYAIIMDLAASGGYYIALAADHIIAHPTSLTGSIGVITIKVNLQGLMDKIGVDWEVVKSGDKKDFLSPFRALTEEEKKLFQETIDSFHNRFVKLIAERRPALNEAKVRTLADGRVFTSEQALEQKLIDSISYLDGTEETIRKDLKVETVKFVSFSRDGEYKNNLYSALPAGQTVNMMNFNLNFLPESPGPHFMYLWSP